jgi:hypothetical protein
MDFAFASWNRNLAHMSMSKKLEVEVHSVDCIDMMIVASILHKSPFQNLFPVLCPKGLFHHEMA